MMEYVAGKTLDQLISAKGLPPLEALGYAPQMASAWPPRTRPASSTATSSPRTSW